MTGSLLLKIGPLVALGYIGWDAAGESADLKDRLEQVMNIVQVSRTQLELGSIRGLVVKEYRWHGNLPQDFCAFVRKNMESQDEKRDVCRDAWETPIKMESSGDGFRIRSCGPDTRCGTNDDVVVEQTRLSKIEVVGR